MTLYYITHFAGIKVGYAVHSKHGSKYLPLPLPSKPHGTTAHGTLTKPHFETTNKHQQAYGNS